MESGNETAVHVKKALDAAKAAKAGRSWVHLTLASPKSEPVIVHALGDRTHKLNVVIKPGELNAADIVDMIGKVFLVAGCDGKRQPDGGYIIELTLTKPCVIDIACDEVNP